MADDRRRRPEHLSDALASYLASSGLDARVDQASIVAEWSALVGPQIASVTEPYAVAADGTLFVGVTTSAWMNELSLMEPQLLAALNLSVQSERTPVRRIRWQLKRSG